MATGTKKLSAMPLLDEAANDDQIEVLDASSPGALKRCLRSTFLSGKISTDDVTFEALDGNDDVGIGAEQVAQGNHLHGDVYYTEDETDSLLGDKSDTGHGHVDLPDLEDWGEKIHAHGEVSGAVTLDRTDGGVQTLTPTGDVQFSLANFTDERSQSMELHITSGAAHTITWPASSLYGGEDGAPELSAYDLVVISTLDGGTTSLITHLESYS